MTDVFTNIEKTIFDMLENNTAYSISKNSGLPYQTVQDLKNGKANISNARYRNIKTLYEYAVKKRPAVIVSIFLENGSKYSEQYIE